MRRLLNALKARHAIIETRVTQEEARPKPDSIRLRMLKKIKLQLRDQIMSIEKMMSESRDKAVRRFPKRRTPLIN